MRYKTNRCSILVLAFAALAGLALAAGCSKPPTRVSVGNQEQILHKGNGSDPQELDPHIVQACRSTHPAGADRKSGHRGPDRFASGTRAGGALGYFTGWHDLHVSSACSIRWSNGDPVTAHDFVRSYRRALTPSLGCE